MAIQAGNLSMLTIQRKNLLVIEAAHPVDAIMACQAGITKLRGMPGIENWVE